MPSVVFIVQSLFSVSLILIVLLLAMVVTSLFIERFAPWSTYAKILLCMEPAVLTLNFLITLLLTIIFIVMITSLLTSNDSNHNQQRKNNICVTG